MTPVSPLPLSWDLLGPLASLKSHLSLCPDAWLNQRPAALAGPIIGGSGSLGAFIIMGCGLNRHQDSPVKPTWSERLCLQGLNSQTSRSGTSAVTTSHPDPSQRLPAASPGRPGTVYGHSRNFVQVHEELQGSVVGSAILDVRHLHRDPWGRQREQWASRLGLNRAACAHLPTLSLHPHRLKWM